MATEIRLPDLGEGIVDVTVVRWRVAVGAAIKRGDVILEVATDKVDTEVAAAADGVLLKVNFNAGELVPVTAVLGYLGVAGEAIGADPGQPAPTAPAAQPAALAQPTIPLAASDEAVKASPVAKRVAADMGVALAGLAGTGPGGQITKSDVLAFAEQGPPGITAPLPGDLAGAPSLSVRRAAAELNVNLDEIAKGRLFSMLTKYDVLSAAASRAAGKEVKIEPAFPPPSALSAASPTLQPASSSVTLSPVTPSPVTLSPVTPTPVTPVTPKAPPQLRPGEELVKHTRMRAAIARNTSLSVFTAPHVTTMWDLDMSAVIAHRSAHKKEFAAGGVNLTLTAYFLEAILAGLRKVPAANASWTDDGVIIKRTYNIGMATALPMDANGLGGLIVPVIKNAGDLTLLGLARAVNELAERARKNELRAEDLADGTFTLSNYGTSGSRFQTPVIVQPQVGILGVGAVEKRLVVASAHPLEPSAGDALLVKPMTTLGFSYDHRVLDGATADAFCAAVKGHLEGYK